MSRAFLLRVALIAAIFIGLPLYWDAFPPRLPVSTANGVYTSVCCGPVQLRDGRLTLQDGREVAYVVEHDNAGRYILPESFIGATDRGFFVERNGNPYKLRLDDDPKPSRLEITKGAGKDVLVLARAKGS
jgi:hypothetical protein